MTTQGLEQQYDDATETAQNPATYKPEGDIDTPIVPRSMVRALTDDGITNREQVATPLDEPEADTDTDRDTEALQALAKTLPDPVVDTQATPKPQPQSETPSQNDANTVPDFESPEMKQFSEQFKSMMGVDLKEAYETFTATQTQLQQQQAAQEAQFLQQQTATLKTEWGVNDAEFNRRIESVLDYTSKLEPELAKQFDSLKGIQVLWEVLERKQPSPTSGISSVSGNKGVDVSGKPPTYRKSELFDMMQNKPALYSKLQNDISRAFAAGTVIDDL